MVTYHMTMREGLHDTIFRHFSWGHTLTTPVHRHRKWEAQHLTHFWCQMCNIQIKTWLSTG